MSAGGARAPTRIPTGNSFDKYGSANPLVRRLMRGFQDTLEELMAQADPGSILDVGCGEGVLTELWAQRLRNGRVVGIDLEDPELRAHWATREHPNLEFVSGRAQELPFGPGDFDLVAAIESLEHVAEPHRMLEEMARVARGHLLVSVPREPAWRALNLIRGAYPRALGNTPGHVNHWTKPAFLDLVSGYGALVAVRSPLPWTVALVRMP